MGKNLVIVESPGKIKSIQKYLDSYKPEDASKSSGKQSFKVVSSYGHIRDLPRNDLLFSGSMFRSFRVTGTSVISHEMI